MKNKNSSDHTPNPKDQIICPDRLSIDLSYIAFKSIYRDFNRIQSSQSRNSKLMVGFGLVGTMSAFISFLKSYFQEGIIPNELFIFAHVLAFVALIFFGYLYFTSKKETSDTLEEYKKYFEEYKNNVRPHLMENSYHSPPPNNSPPNLRVESG